MSELSNFKNTQEIIKKHNFSIQKKIKKVAKKLKDDIQ